MSKQFGVFSVETAAEIHRRVLGNSSPQKPTDGQKQLLLPAREYYVKLTEDLAEASNPETGYTQAEAVFLRYKQPAEDTLSMEESGEDSTLTVTNRSTSYSATSGSVLQVKRIGAEWAPVHASGGANSTSDDCPCDCLDSGDIAVNGFSTSSVWSTKLPALEFQFPNGVVTMPSGTKTIVWDEARQKWVLDIGDSLTAKYPDGTDATSISTLDGEITLTFNVGSDSELKVCVTATIPPDQSVDNIVVYPQETGYNYGYTNGFSDAVNGRPYDDRVVFAGPTGTGAGTGAFQNFGTGTVLEPGTGTYGDLTGTGTGTGTFMWSDEEEQFYIGYKSGYAEGWAAGLVVLAAGTGVPLIPPPEDVFGIWQWNGTGSYWTELESYCTNAAYPNRNGYYSGEIVLTECFGTGSSTGSGTGI